MIAQVRPGELNAWLAQVRGAQAPLVIDVREPHELATASIGPGDYDFIAIPMNSVAQRLAELDPERPVACLCHHGGRSMQVAGFLASRGFTQVANIAGGIDAWSLERDATIARY